MPFPRSPRRADADAGILPLTNVIFLLLLFFMLVGHLAAPHARAIHPPNSEAKQQAPTTGILVQLSADGGLAVDGSPIDLAGLHNAVAGRLQANPGASVRLLADGQVAATQVVAVMQSLRAAGANKLRLLTTSK